MLINVDKIIKLGLSQVENFAGKAENAINEHFLLFSQCFRKTVFSQA